jgi:RNA-dependent RNA polymerase
MPETEDFKPDTVGAAAYSPVEPHDLERPVNIHDVADFVVDYINSDKMGLVSIQHLIICEPISIIPIGYLVTSFLADQSRRGLHDPKCLKLAELHSKAVRYF